MQSLRHCKSQAEKCAQLEGEFEEYGPKRAYPHSLFLVVEDLLSKIKSTTDSDVKVTKSNWRLMVDEYTQMKFSDFYETKDGMVDPTCKKLNMCWKQQGKPVEIIRLDNAGENVKLKDAANGKDWKFNITLSTPVEPLLSAITW